MQAYYIYTLLHLCTYLPRLVRLHMFCTYSAPLHLFSQQIMNQSLFTAKVSFLPRVDCSENEIKAVTLGKTLLSDKWRAKVEAIRREKDQEKRKALKAALPCFTPAGTFSRVRRMGLQNPSGFLCVDIDCKPDKGINSALEGYDLKAHISAVPYVAYCGLSCGGEGYFLLIPIEDPAKYQDYYKALQEDFEKCGIEIDPACKDISRKRFVSWDPDPYINTAAKPYAYTLPERKHRTRETLGREINLTEETAKVEALLSDLEARRIDITADYENWRRVLSALASTFGEAGREYAHRVSALNSGYNPEETDTKYNDLLRHPEYKDRLGTLFYIADQETGLHDFDGIGLSASERES